MCSFDYKFTLVDIGDSGRETDSSVFSASNIACSVMLRDILDSGSNYVYHMLIFPNNYIRHKDRQTFVLNRFQNVYEICLLYTSPSPRDS